MRTLIIGYGNPLRGDDGLGWRVAEELRRLPAFAQAEVLFRHQLTPELAEPVSRAQAVFFIDAARDGAPGQVKRREVSPQSLPGRFSHAYSPEELLGLARLLYGACAFAVVFSITGECFGHGEQLSRVVAAQIPELIAKVVETAHDAGQWSGSNGAVIPVQLAR